MDTRIIRIDPLHPEQELIEEASTILARGGLVAIPTETVYGLASDTYNVDAVKRIFYVKGRPMDNPLIVHIDSVSRLNEVATDIHECVFRVAERVWPGPVTFILRRSPSIPKEVSAGLDTIAVRSPAHRVALSIIECLDKPIAAPSANLSGRPSPTNAMHVIKDLMCKIDAIVDSGDTFFGVESTVISLLEERPVLLRPGPIEVDELSKILGMDIIVPDYARGIGYADTALSPGIKHRHYSPDTRLVLVESQSVDMLVEKASSLVDYYTSKGLRVGVIASRETSPLYKTHRDRIVIGSRNDLYEVAKNLFKVLREVDELRFDIVVVEGFEEKGIGLAIMNRLRKASTEVIRA
jgi:L-threonylcarbamoyladenylate synthase